ncbi:MAG: hypothetical protein FGM54_02295 [Chitinophagaceae bacterium]|nr:hypothetical protein [Chitinophagaceae bacterium]
MNLKKLYHDFFSPRTKSELYFVHRRDSNLGDQLSAPYLYYAFKEHQVLDICDAKAIAKMPQKAQLIIGGGGLIMPYFDAYRAALLARNPSKLVWWGIGERRIQNLETAYLSETAAQASIEPQWFEERHLVGFRQTTPYYPFLPCVSCKAVAEYREKKPQASHQYPVVYFEHRHVPLPTQTQYPVRNNEGESAHDVFSFLDQAPIVVTNSYHGMYWSTLLGKQVVVLPFSSGLYHNPWPVHYANHQNVSEIIQGLSKLPPENTTKWLKDCIERNDAFYQLVLNYFASSEWV